MMWLLQTIVCMFSFAGGLADVFSALSGMEAIVETEGALLDSLHNYLIGQEERLKLLRRHYDNYNKEYTTATVDVSNYLSNPINAFKIIKRLNVDWAYTYKVMDYHVPARNLSELKESYLFPDAGDLTGSSEAIVRLQDLYQLDTAELAEGRILGKQTSFPMTAADCFELGHQLANLEFFSNSSSWFSVALHKYETEGNNDIKAIKGLLEYMGYSSYMRGDIKMAVSALGQLLALEPNHQRALDDFHKYSELQHKSNVSELVPCRDKMRASGVFKNYDQLCRDELDLPDIIRKDLKCFYLTKNDPFLRLAPVKVEEHYLDPYVAVFYDVIYEKEINYIKEAAKSRLKRASVVDFATKSEVHSRFRVNKHCWMYDNEHEVINRVNQRIRDLTGLALESAEALQVANYGAGGFYEPHFDFSTNTEKHGFSLNNDENGNRIATLIYYLSDVEHGGRTVFPELGVGVTPRKGSALFWFNLHPSGEGNYAALHGACPVLQGTKWIANKWIRQRGQEFRVPCNLEYQEEGLIKTYPDPVLKADQLVDQLHTKL